MADLVNLIVELSAFDADAGAAARRRLDARGITVDTLPPGRDDAVLSWIDATFGGTWSSEAFAATTLVARLDRQPVAFVAYDARGLNFAWLSGIAREDGVGIFGPFGAAPEHRGGDVAPDLLVLAMVALRERGYARALVPAVGEGALSRYYERIAGARIVERFHLDALQLPAPRTLVMASGNGTNFQSVADAVEAGQLSLDLRAVVCNTPGAKVLERARTAGVPGVHTVAWDRTAESRAAYDARLRAVVEAEAPQLVLLLGWMHLLDAAFVNAFPALLNVHPAFLPLDPSADSVTMPDGSTIPAIRGARAIRDAIRTGVRWSGVSMHVVTPATDRGDIVMRKPLTVPDGCDSDALAARIHSVEHQLVPAAVRAWLLRR